MSATTVYQKTWPFLMLKAMIATGYAGVLLLVLWLVIQLTRTASVWTIIFVYAFAIVLAVFLWKGIYRSLGYVLEQAHLYILARVMQGQQVSALPVHEGTEAFKKMFTKASFLNLRKHVRKTVTQLTPAKQEGIVSFLFLDKLLWLYAYRAQTTALKGVRDACMLLHQERTSLLKKVMQVQGILLTVSSFLFFIIYGVFAKSVPVLGSAPFFFSLIITGWCKVVMIDQLVLPKVLRSWYGTLHKPLQQLMVERTERVAYAFKNVLQVAGRDVQQDPYIQQLLPYVQQYLKQGWSRAQIKQSLVKNGWPAVSVDAALERV